LPPLSPHSLPPLSPDSADSGKAEQIQEILMAAGGFCLIIAGGFLLVGRYYFGVSWHDLSLSKLLFPVLGHFVSSRIEFQSNPGN